MKSGYKTTKTVKDFKTEWEGFEFTVKAGANVDNKTALGFDDNYHFLRGVDKIEGLPEWAMRKSSMFNHHFKYHGINIPKEYCEPYKNN